GTKGRRRGEYVNPTVIAASDSFLATADADLHRIEIRQRDGAFIQSVDSIPFVPLGGVALRTREWIFYGPSHPAVTNQTWIHCLRITKERAEWQSGFVTRAATDVGITDATRMVATEGEAVIAHREGSDSVLIRAGCDSGRVTIRETQSLDGNSLDSS